jgi:hypothetical protein
MRSKAALVPYEKSMKIWSMVTKTHNVKILRAKNKRFTFFPPPLLKNYSSAPPNSSLLIFPFQGKKE